MSNEALRIQDDLIRAMSPGEKLRVSQGLRATAWRFKAAWIRECNPSLSEAEVQERVREVFRDAGE